ncbi:class I SAM-dependent methyltransferase, partial [Candidatus Bathyarchaeota archaeon]|nr:class I SAM-dependent methyltransferase [Candidatus Bathyarchaeota archaeon]
PLNTRVFKDRIVIDQLFGDGLAKVKYIQMDIDKERLPFPDRSFDVIVLTDVLEHLYDPGFALDEVTRVAKPKSYLLLKTVNCATLKNRVNLLLGKSPYHNFRGWLFDDRFYVPHTGEKKFQGHIREYTNGELKMLLNCYGFNPLRMKTYPAVHYSARARYKRGTLLKFYNILERLYPNFAYTVIIVAQKDSTWRSDSE